MRALRFCTANVPKPTIWTSLSFLRPRWIDWISALTARSACAFEHSVPSCFWTSSTRSALFMGSSVELPREVAQPPFGRAPQESTGVEAAMARLRCPESLVPCGLSARVFAPTDSAQAADAKVSMLQARGESAFCTPELDEDTHEDRGLRSHTAA